MEKHTATGLNKQYLFVALSVNELKEMLQDETDLFMCKLSDEQLDATLERAHHKGWIFWNSDGSFDLSELDSLAKILFDEDE